MAKATSISVKIEIEIDPAMLAFCTRIYNEGYNKGIGHDWADPVWSDQNTTAHSEVVEEIIKKLLSKP